MSTISDRLADLFQRKPRSERADEGVIPNRAQRRAAGFVRRGPAYKQEAPQLVRYFRRHYSVAAIPAHERTRRQRKQYARVMRALNRRLIHE